MYDNGNIFDVNYFFNNALKFNLVKVKKIHAVYFRNGYHDNGAIKIYSSGGNTFRKSIPRTQTQCSFSKIIKHVSRI